jgi:hypothetical protein
MDGTMCRGAEQFKIIGKICNQTEIYIKVIGSRWYRRIPILLFRCSSGNDVKSGQWDQAGKARSQAVRVEYGAVEDLI